MTYKNLYDDDSFGTLRAEDIDNARWGEENTWMDVTEIGDSRYTDYNPYKRVYRDGGPISYGNPDLRMQDEHYGQTRKEK